MKKCFLLAGFAVLAVGAGAQETYGLTTDNRLISFDAANPTALNSNVQITGLNQQNELVLGIDFRPKTGELYAVGSSNQIYKINTSNGVASAVGGTFAPPLTGVEFGFDFNPTVDRIRLTGSTGQNLRLHPDTGAVVSVDGTLAYAAGDPNFGAAPNVVGSAYTNNFNGAGSTTLYNIDSDLDILVTQIPPNSGTLNTVGGLGMKVGSLVGFDIMTVSGNNMAYVAAVEEGDFRSWFHRIDLATGKLNTIGAIGGTAFLVRDIALNPVPEPATIAALGLGVAAFLRRRR
ncbi:MAG: hypothetical protein HONBIEJF_02177 [Fimbriimonadaceae bacterium]|nr:hypothetical protein [Fimbriimonadaceae bacterium]